MRSITFLLASTLIMTQIAGPAFAFPDREETFSRRPELGVLVLRSVGKELSGASLELCRVTGSSSEKRNDAEAGNVQCRSGSTDQSGEFVFQQIGPGEYRLTVELDGFVPTSIGSMSVNAEDPIAPDRVVVVLNAACYDC